MIYQFITLSVIAIGLLSTGVNGRIIFHRMNVSDNLKQFNLSPAEFDQNVAPPSIHQQIATIGPEEILPNSPSSITVSIASGEKNDAGSISVQSTNAPTSGTTGVTLHQPITTKKPESSGFSKYCKCTESNCNCCRDIGIPIFSVQSPGCAKISYVGDDKISVSLKYGDFILASRTISGKKARPLCVGFPGGYSKFCGRVYGLSKINEDFKACLGFELRADDEVEAALRVSCFKFGPRGVRITEPEPLPSQTSNDDDFFDFGGDDDDDEDYDSDDDDDYRNANYGNEEYAEAPEDADYSGFNLESLLEELEDDDQEKSTKSHIKKVIKSELNSTRIVSGRKDAMQNKSTVQSKAHSNNEVIVTHKDKNASLRTTEPRTTVTSNTTMTSSSATFAATTDAVYGAPQRIKNIRPTAKWIVKSLII